MATQRVIHVVPIRFLPTKRVMFTRALLLPGVTLHRYAGPLARDIKRRTEALSVEPGFFPTHLLSVNQTEYLLGLDTRLQAEGRTRPAGVPDRVDIAGLSRQVLVAATLLGQLTWSVGGYHAFDFSDGDFSYRTSGYSHTPTVEVWQGLQLGASGDWFSDVYAAPLRDMTLRLDRYYRSGIWWNDRLSIALGYLWSALTTSHPELSFAALCMALEAVATSSQTEVTHTLAERCALLCQTRGPGRLQAYTDIKQLYALRSKIVHGRSGPRKGPITYETLAITAKMSMVPLSQLHKLLSYVLAVIRGALKNKSLTAILHTKQSDDAESRAIDEFFQRQLLTK